MQSIRAFGKAFSLTFFVLAIIALLVMSVHAVDTGAVYTPTAPVTDTRAVTPPADKAGGTSPQFLDSGVVDDSSAPPVTTMAEDVHAIRQYIEFTLFVLLPLALAIGLIALGCWWFWVTFLRV